MDHGNHFADPNFCFNIYAPCPWLRGCPSIAMCRSYMNSRQQRCEGGGGGLSLGRCMTVEGGGGSSRPLLPPSRATDLTHLQPAWPHLSQQKTKISIPSHRPDLKMSFLLLTISNSALCNTTYHIFLHMHIFSNAKFKPKKCRNLRQ